MLTDELISAIAHFFDAGVGPTHDEISRMFARAGLASADPRLGPDGTTVGKAKRVRQVLSFALDHDPAAGEKLVRSLIGAIKATGGFRPGSPSYASAAAIEAAQAAFHVNGFDLDPEGELRARTLEGLDGRDLTDALQAYVRRARLGSEDAALLTGTSKDLLEATARHVLVLRTGSYPVTGHFPTTLYQAFDRLGLTTPPPKLLDALDPDPVKAIQQCLWLLGVKVNTLRNKEGTGHGRPTPSKVTTRQSQMAAQAVALVSQLLLDELA